MGNFVFSISTINFANLISQAVKLGANVTKVNKVCQPLKIEPKILSALLAQHAE